MREISLRLILRIIPGVMLVAIVFMLTPGTTLANASRTASVNKAEHALYTCSGPSCNGLDPADTGCVKSTLSIMEFDVFDTNSVNTNDINDVNKHLIAIGYNIYSYGCKAYWTEGKLNPVGAKVPQGHSIIVGAYLGSGSSRSYITCFPAGPGTEWDNNCATQGYDGATGWPAVSNMVDGTGTDTAISFVEATGPDGKAYEGEMAGSMNTSQRDL